jgi:hypothetical protein
VLDVDGAVDKSRVDEFRANNITLANQLADHKRRFEGIDPDEARQLAEKQALQAGEIEKVIDGLVRTVKNQTERHYSIIVAERGALRASVSSLPSERRECNAVPQSTSKAQT